MSLARGLKMREYNTDIFGSRDD